MNRIRALIVLALALGAALVIAACGGGGGGDEDPQQVLTATFNNEQKVESGSFDVSVDVSAEGGENAGSFEATLGGPFQSQEGKFPLFDIDADIKLESSAQDFSGSGGLTSAGDKAFVNFQDTDYEVPQQLFDQFTASFTQLQQQSQAENADSGSFLKTLGIDPTNWLTDVSNEGDEDVDGTETIHISGKADVPKLIEDIKQIAQNAPQAAGQVNPQQLSQLDQLTTLIKSADFDIFTGKDDDLLRKLEANLELTPPAGTPGAPESVNLGFTITLSDVNEPQEISAPSGAQPLSTLLQQFGIDESQLGQLGSAFGGASSGGSVPQAGGSPAAPSGATSQAYLECLQQAQGAGALQQCSALLGQ